MRRHCAVVARHQNQGCVKLLSKKVRFSYLLQQQHVHFLDMLAQQIAESYLPAQYLNAAQYHVRATVLYITA